MQGCVNESFFDPVQTGWFDRAVTFYIDAHWIVHMVKVITARAMCELALNSVLHIYIPMSMKRFHDVSFPISEKEPFNF